MAEMTGEVALVLGGSRGIGFAIAQRLYANGADVVITGRRADDVAAASAALGERAFGKVGDAGSRQDVERIVAEVVDQFGRIDMLVLNAGICEPATLDETTSEHIDRHFVINVQSQIFGLRAAAAAMPPGSAVVLVGSAAAQQGLNSYGTYAATKAAIRSYARSWALELAPREIRINVVSPGPIDTETFGAVPNEFRDQAIAQVPLKRMGKPAEIGAAAAFLLSKDASFITGADLCVDGGAAQV